ncbi:DNRLRE domain-containing protein [Neobacillus niacini]|uniref:DNRLRE domain-containing protein n=1 Tax=Neobacillus niacini TaxID=86668 RepID=UPI0005F00A15|nr:DNRLRE domain-containing protein [Neobacillus niacini]
MSPGKKKNQLYKSIVWSIIFMLLLSLIPPLQGNTLAAETKETVKNVNELKELTGLRTEKSKTYLDSKTREYVLEEYTEPIHYKKDKKWENIDNTVVNGKPETDDADLSLENKANKYSVKFAKKNKDNRTIRLKWKEKQLEFGLAGANRVTGEVEKNSVTYPGVFPNIDLRFFVDNNAVKEELVLHSKPEQNQFTYEVNMKGLEAKEGQNGEILFQDNEGDTFYTLTKPFMYDSVESVSHDMTMKLRVEKGKTYIDVTFAQEWINSPDRKFPVIVDPSVIIHDATTEDNMISSTYPNSNYWLDPSIYTGKQVYYGTTRTLMRFNLKNLLSGAKITSANFRLSSHSNTNGYNHTAGVGVFPISKSWDTTTVMWNNQPTIDAQVSSLNVTTDGDYTFFITNLVKDWYIGKKANYGFMLKNTDENINRKMFWSSDYSADPLKKPKLTVNYTIEPIGVESFWTSAESNVNTYNGNFFNQEIDFTIDGRGLPLTVNRTYNSRSTESGMFGYGWSSNLDQKLTFASDDLVLYRDEDGTQHYFSKNSSGGYDSPGGVYLQLEKNANGTFKLIDKDQSYVTFDTTGKLVSETDSNNNKTTYTYTGSQLTSVTDPSGRKITIGYGTNGKVNSIVDLANREYKYTYDANENLTGFSKTDSNRVITQSTAYGYDTVHQMTSYTDEKGKQMFMSYNADKRLVKHEQPVTVQGTLQTDYYTMVYDTSTGISTMTDARGVKTEYTHNAYGNVTKVISDVGGLNYTRTYNYDDKNNLIQEKDENTIKNGSTAAYNYTYDENGNVTGFTNTLNEQEKIKYDENNNPVEFTDAKGNVSTEEYDTKNNNVTSTDAATKSSATKYDANGNATEETTSVSIGESFLLNGSFENDGNNDNWPDNWKKVGTATFTYDTSGAAVQNAKLGSKQIKISNPSTAVAVESDRISYNPQKKYVVSGYIKTTNANSNAKLVITGGNSSGQMTQTISSAMLKGTTGVERMHFVINPGDLPSDTTFMTLKAYVNAGTGDYFFDGLQIEEEYYGAFNLIENSNFELDADSNGVPDGWYLPGTLTSSDGIDSTTAYAGGKSIKLTGQRGVDKFIRQELKVNGTAGQEITVSGFSKVDAPTTSAGPYQMNIAINHTDGTIQWVNGDFDKSKSHDWQHVSLRFAATKDFKSLTVYYQYKDQTGTAWFDAAKAQAGSIRTKSEYDSLGNYVINSTDPNGKTVWKSYDTLGNVTGETVEGDTWNYEYDSNDNLTKVLDEYRRITTYEYDKAGNHTETINANGKKSVSTYNERNNITSFTDALGHSILYEYDLVGNETKIISPNGSVIENTYNNVDRKTATLHNGVRRFEFTYDANGNLLTEKDLLTGVTTTFVYDADDKLTVKSDSTGKKNLYTYDKNGNLLTSTFSSGTSNIAVNRSVDKNNQTTSITSGNTEITFTFTESDQVAGIKNKNGIFSLYNYDGAGQITRLLTTDKQGTSIESFDYTYDAKGNRVSEKTSSGTAQFIFDKSEQLTKEVRPNGDILEFTYDAVGNRLTKKVTKGTTVTTDTYTYDAANQLSSINGMAVTHDKSGNMTSDGKRTFIYDADDRLIEVKEGTTSLGKYQYNSEGLRVSKTTGTTTVYYTYDENDNVVLETDHAGTIIASYVYDNANRPLTMTKDGKTYTFHVNVRGDITSVTDEAGIVVARFEYDSWGNIVKETGTFASNVPFRYAGYRYDLETKLYYLQQRYYNPEIGRFLTLDRVLGDKENPITQNGYAYADNNPVMFVDADGNFAHLVIYGGIAAYRGYKLYKGYKKVYKVYKVAKKVKKNTGRSGKQARLRELANDPKVSRSLRGEIKRDINEIKRNKRKNIRVPKGYHLRHRYGYEAKKGYSYKYTDLQTIRSHRVQHKYHGY